MLRIFFLLTFFSFVRLVSFGQDVTECPQNIGFEEGTLNHWQASTAEIRSDGSFSAFVPGEIPGRHTLIKKNTETDPWGTFPLNSPNGSEYIIRLGNKAQGSQVDRISYTIKIPPDVESYAIMFNYAVVFQNPNHEEWQQPKFTVDVIDENTNTRDECASFAFTSQNGLPGFLQAENDALFKPWSSVMINLTKYLGHTIRLEFTANDCSEAAHFGYAYIDFNENCATPVTGNITCPESGSITLTAFPGFAKYRWYNAATMEVYSTNESAHFDPSPPIGTRIAVDLEPYPYSGGCVQTLYSVIKNMGDLLIKPPPVSCLTVDLTSPNIVKGNSPAISYTYWKDPLAQIPLLNPADIRSGGTYYIMGKLLPSGCFSIMPVPVKIIPLPPIAVHPPDPVNYPGTIDLTKIFDHEAGVTYTYWIDKSTKRQITSPTNVDVGGIFYIKGVDPRGCIVVTAVRADIALADIIIPNTFTPNGDGINDVLTVLLDTRIHVESFKVFNRWGQQVYETSDIHKFWNGYRGNTSPLPGVYYWVLSGEEQRRKYIRKGTVTVIR